jgi:hypothetical protein
MKCQLMVGASWDDTTDPPTIVDWDKRVPCDNDAEYIYTYKLPTFQGTQTHLCQQHHHSFKQFLGTLQPYFGEEK